MEYPAGNQYQLVFEAKEKKTGLAVQKKILMRVTSEYSKGWFILEDENGMTDMVLFKRMVRYRESFNRKIRGKNEGRGCEISVHEW